MIVKRKKVMSTFRKIDTKNAYVKRQELNIHSSKYLQCLEIMDETI